jgi:hypothetical protein
MAEDRARVLPRRAAGPGPLIPNVSGRTWAGLITARIPVPAAILSGVSAHPGQEQNWYPVSRLGWFAGHIREGIAVTRHQLELLEPARSQPYLLDDATVARTIQVHQDQAGEALIAELRQVNSEVLAVAAELAHGTIETVLAKSDLELGIEALMRGPRP